MRPQSMKVKVKPMLYVAETEKAYCVASFNKLDSAVASRNSVTSWKDAKDAVERGGATVWIPKSQVQDVVFSTGNYFPMLEVRYPSKRNEKAYAYKTEITCKVSDFIVAEHQLPLADGEVLNREGTPTDAPVENDGWS